MLTRPMPRMDEAQSDHPCRALGHVEVKAATDGKGLPSVAKTRLSRPMVGPTIYDVAAAAGVATSTVSRAFSSPSAGQRQDPGAGAGGGRRARLPAQPARPRSAVGPSPHGRDGGLRHHQPALLRADPRRRDAGHGHRSTRWCSSTPRSHRASSTTRSSAWSPSVDGFVLAASRLPDENLRQIAAQRPVVLMSRELSGTAPAWSSTTSRAAGRSWSTSPRSDTATSPTWPGRANSWMANDPVVGAAQPRPRISAWRRVASAPSRPKVSQGGAAADGALNAGDHGDRRAQRPAGHRRRAAPRAALGAGAGRRQRGGVRRHLRRRPVHAHGSRRSAALTPRSGRAAVELLLDRRDPRPPPSRPRRSTLPTEPVLRASTGLDQAR